MFHGWASHSEIVVVCWTSILPVFGSTSRLAHNSLVAAWRRLKCTMPSSEIALLNRKPCLASFRRSSSATDALNCSAVRPPPAHQRDISHNSRAISWQVSSTVLIPLIRASKFTLSRRCRWVSSSCHRLHPVSGREASLVFAERALLNRESRRIEGRALRLLLLRLLLAVRDWELAH